MSCSNKKKSTDLYFVFEVGAYFGHSVVAVDLNRDGYDDLVVGAPYYTGQLRDQGQVYTYINTQNVSKRTHDKLLLIIIVIIIE